MSHPRPLSKRSTAFGPGPHLVFYALRRWGACVRPPVDPGPLLLLLVRRQLFLVRNLPNPEVPPQVECGPIRNIQRTVVHVHQYHWAQLAHTCPRTLRHFGTRLEIEGLERCINALVGRVSLDLKLGN